MRIKLAVIGTLSALALPQAALAQDTQTRNVGAWEIVTIVDPITDQGRAIGVLHVGRAFLAVKCDAPGRNSVYVHFGSPQYLGGRGASSDSRDLTYRFDQDEPVTARWTYSDSSAGLFDDRRAASFVQRLATAERVAVRASTYRYETVTEVFEIVQSDVQEVIRAVYATCNAGDPPLMPSGPSGAL